MSLQSITASVPVRRLQGVRRFTAPLFIVLAAIAFYDAATVHDASDAMVVSAVVR